MVPKTFREIVDCEAFPASRATSITERKSFLSKGVDIGNTEHLFIGYSGNGALAISNGGAVSDAAAYLGVNAGSNGAATLSGSGSAWTSTNNLVAGYSGTGSVTISSGGAAYDDGGYAGYGAGSSGTVTVSGSGSKWANTGDTFIADSGTGTLAINGGGAVSDFAGYIGLNAGSRGVATLSGTGSKWTDTSNFVAGFVGAGTVTSSSGAALSDSNGYIGYGATGAVTLSGSGTDFSMAGNSLATFNLQQENSFSGPAFTIGGASGIAPGLIFDIGNAGAGADLLHVTKTVSVLATGGKVTIDALAGDTSLTAGNYDLITTAGGFSGANGNGLALSGTTLAISGATYDLSLAHSTADDEILTVSESPPSAPESSFARFDASSQDLTRSTPAGHADAPLAGTAAVPEPGAVACLVSAFWIVSAWMPRRRRGLRRNEE